MNIYVSNSLMGKIWGGYFAYKLELLEEKAGKKLYQKKIGICS